MRKRKNTMANSKKARKHSIICIDCKGNGYRQFTLEEGREHVVIQCETCDSEGEIYVDESEVIESYLDVDTVADDVGKLH
jgi:transcription elongation factor Elf1|tara:strand:- start:1558 stop:1797 length:240 start_codon:yes stop_codon:yes gene_type:complete